MSLCQRLSVLVASDRRDSVAAPDDEVSRVFERRKIFEIEENMSKSTKSAAAQSHFASAGPRQEAAPASQAAAGQAPRRQTATRLAEKQR